LGQNLAVLVHSDDTRVMVVEQDGDIVGFASTTLGFGLEQGRVAEFEDLYVRPAHRRGGIACVLIDDSAYCVTGSTCRIWRTKAAAARPISSGPSSGMKCPAAIVVSD
jgi:predicted GNAT family acetyltransferase